MGQLAQRGRQQQMVKADPASGLQTLLKDTWEQISALMPRHMTSTRLFQMSVNAINHTPGLLEASPETLLSCIMKCAALGLEPSAVDGLGNCYILPYRNHGVMEAQFILGYKGMLRLARNSGQLESIESRGVHKGDVFEFEFGLNEKLRHVPKLGGKGEMTHVYCLAKFRDGGHYLEVMTKEEVDGVRKRSKASKNGPWVTDYEAMARKTVVRRAFPYLPVSVAAQEAVAADEMTPDYTAVFKPVMSVEVESESAEPEKPAQPTDAEKAELRALTDKCVAVGYNEREIASKLYGQWKVGGIEAARVTADLNINAMKNGFDPETGEVFDEEADLADEDIPFGEDPEE